MNILESLLPINPYSRPGRSRRALVAIIYHWVAKPGASAASVRSYFASLAAPRHSPTYASAHYVVGLRGEIVRCVPEAEVAYHCGSSKPDPASGLVYTDWARARFGEAFTKQSSPNMVTIGIEMCHPDGSGRFNPETEAAAAALGADLCRRYGLDPLEALGRHYDIVGWKDCPRYWVKHGEAWEAFKRLVAGLATPQEGA